MHVNTKTMERINTLYNMHECIRNWGGDEDCYMRWILVVPDCPMMEDFYDIAEDMKEYEEVVRLFWYIVEDMLEEECFEDVYKHLKKYDIQGLTKSLNECYNKT